jgi:uncharacterized membrane protein YgdD (TMEM256/DUF423 family)
VNAAARIFLVAGALVLAAGVALGAIGAHAARTAPHPEAARLIQTAVLYQLVHGIALILAGVLARFARTRWLEAAGASFLLGTASFCGSLYWLAFSGVSAGVLAPIGGTAFIAGWILLAIHALVAERS